ncbi:hypothetical protein RvY_03132 [Ramazzottius varieornatus]|uniref:Uncharacterized protein n=1 Tax=Ramazzottius varieornatus TaxID=947166 RepID=A0A1D1UX68_RAMVA|nr:hypothetical protein RvY_03132 [Ramazzottius varieornatus]
MGTDLENRLAHATNRKEKKRLNKALTKIQRTHKLAMDDLVSKELLEHADMNERWGEDTPNAPREFSEYDYALAFRTDTEWNLEYARRTQDCIKSFPSPIVLDKCRLSLLGPTRMR